MSLFDLIQDVKLGERELESIDRHQILMKASFGLAELHRIQIVHRDSTFSERLHSLRGMSCGEKYHDLC